LVIVPSPGYALNVWKRRPSARWCLVDHLFLVEPFRLGSAGTQRLR
jgi:hypothetical protein